MFQKLLLLFLVLIGVGILIFRLTGSGDEISRRTQFFTNPFTDIFSYTLPEGDSPYSGDAPFPFPNTPEIGLEEINKDGLPADYFTAGSEAYEATRDDLVDIEAEYDTLKRRAVEAQTFGDPSPYRGLAGITDSYGGVAGEEAALEYIVVSAASDNTAPVSLAGWSLQSVRTRGRYYIPGGTRSFRMGRIAETASVSLSPGERAIISTGASPVGASFLENLCTGYLGQHQTFLPSLDERCPSPEDEVSAEPATARLNDPTCVDFASTIDRCEFFMGSRPEGVSNQCYSFVRNALTYNGCLARHSWRPSFAGDTWRLFIGQPSEIWPNDADVIRLLDAQGRVVDAWSY